MSLRRTFDRTNMILSRGLSVRYYVTSIDDAGCHLKRVATKEYSFVGMTEAAARACRDAKRAQYTHTAPDGNIRIDAGVDVERHGAGWACRISVSETDERTVEAVPIDPADVFAAENLRDYDEEDALLKITGMSRSGDYLVILFSQSIDGFNPDRLMVGYLDSPSDRTFETVEAKVSISGKSVDAKMDPIGRVIVLIYGSIVSNRVVYK